MLVKPPPRRRSLETWPPLRVRGPGGYSLPGLHAFGPRVRGPLETALQRHLFSRTIAGTMVVLPLPGHASLLASKLDATPPEGMVGCIAGDDTIFIATLRRRGQVLVRALDAMQEGVVA